MAYIKQDDAAAVRALMRSMYFSNGTIDGFLATATAGQVSAVRGLIASGCHRIVVIEPFLFSVPEELLTWRPRLHSLCQLLRARIAQMQADFPAVSISCISVQERFDTAAKKDGIRSMTVDGIHLTKRGHRMLADILLTYL